VIVRSSTGGGLEATLEHGEEPPDEAAARKWHRLMPVGRDLFLMNPHADVYLSFIREGSRVAGVRLLAGGAVQNLVREEA
jgi:hypothetical protein